MALLKLDPVLKEKVWGGTKLGDLFGYSLPSETTGECWAISAHENGASTVTGGPYDGRTLRDLWENEPSVFGITAKKEFPLLVKLLHAADDLSVQVHPDDAYAEENEGYAYGKTECWYVVSAEEGAELVLGHHASTREEFRELAEAGEWEKLFRRVPVKAGDFVYVPSGTVHAIGAGIVLLEVQQSSDITYRVYDYDRPGQDGNLRELHLEDSINCATVPHEDQTPERRVWHEGDVRVEELVENDYFNVRSMHLNGFMMLRRRAPYQLISVLEGAGEAQVSGSFIPVQKGDHFLVPADVPTVKWHGELHLVVAEPGPEA
ncbi:mannose-6-phosphate isomerase, class I [Alkalicoccus urumqiensis]|uniref:Mannose-6-phosphate isomerase n=1 Tax=Alkalicoccus urumqiensis TaxID=1548213 RepID=A0A2P6MHA2_ALKUR|nr:mannose-6-phosphate isomerase, class I [Alkalicoccus urumqiensis]PRO65620.1 mannose-6-phosphate isomerase, class I [Alkalicoccus urumqiensis]